MAEMLGYNRAEIIGRFIWDFAGEEDKGIFQVKLANRKKGIDEVYECKLIRKDGLPVWFLVSAKASFDDAGKFAGSLGMFTDITDRKRVEQELRESKARVESIFRSAPVGIGVVVDRIIKKANERLCEMTGYSREELLGKSALMLYPTVEEYERVGLVKYGMIAKRGTGYVETRWQRKDGSVVDILLSSSPIVPGDLSGEITFTALDITERKRAEGALKRAYDSLENKVKERTLELEKAYNSLKESEKSLAEAQRMAHIGNWDNDLVTGELYWSDEMYRIFGCNPREGITYYKFLSYIHPDDRNYVYNSTKEAFKGKIYATELMPFWLMSLILE
jgi:PAS domain S-box-containing protein